MKNILIPAVLVLSSLALISFYPQKGKDNTLSKKEKKGGWVLLFDGKTTTGWKTYRGNASDAWYVENQSFSLDLRILMATPYAILMSERGLYDPLGVHKLFTADCLSEATK